MKTVPSFLFKAAHAFYSTVDAPAPRNLEQELKQTLSGEQATAPGFLALEQQFQPQYADLARSTQTRNMVGTPGAPGTLAINRLQRTADINDVARLGPAATAAILKSNPYLNNSLNSLYSRTNDSPILSSLNTQAQEGLQQGGALSAQDTRNVVQATRAGQSARGTALGNNNLITEVLAQDAARRSRLAAAQQFAGNVQGMNQAQNDFVGRTAQIDATTLGDPFQTVLGRTSGAGGGGQQQIGTGARLFDPTSPYINDIYQSNQNAAGTANIANTQAQNSTTSSLIGLAGSLILSDKRAKKNIVKIGKTKSNETVYKWTYKGSKKTFIGPIAQTMEKENPRAVVIDPFSKAKMVDMRKTSVPLLELAT